MTRQNRPTGAGQPLDPAGQMNIAHKGVVYEFSKDVSANTTETVSRTIQTDALLRHVIIGWPDGANNLVGVKFGTNTGEDYIPRNAEDDYIAANDFTHPFVILDDVEEDGVLEAEFQNNDSNNSHFINVFAELVEEPPALS